MIILGLDCATKTGFCLVRDGQVIESGTQDFAKRRGESNGGMFLRFRAWLNGMIGITWNPKLVAYEQAHHRGGAATEICVNLTGRVQEQCAGYGIEYATVHSATLKKWATGNGRGSKEEMITWAEHQVKRPVVDDNEADAIAVALWAWSEYGSHDKLKEANP